MTWLTRKTHNKIPPLRKVRDRPSSQQTVPTTPAPIVLTADAFQALIAHVARSLPVDAQLPPTGAPTNPLPQTGPPPFHSTSANVLTPGPW